MTEIKLENTAKEKIVETQEESEEDDEIIFTLLVDGKIASWAKDLTLQLLRRNTYGSYRKTQGIWTKTARLFGEKC